MASTNDRQSNGNNTATSGTRKRSTTHPRNTLQQAEELAKLILKEGPRNCDADIIAKAAGFSGSNNGSFATLRATASQFGMVVSDGQTISVSEEWIGILWQDDSNRLKIARQQAMRQPDLYKQLLEEYAQRQLPSVEKLAQQLYINQKYGILKDAAGVAAKVFFESASYAGLINDRNFIQLPDDTILEKEESNEGTTRTQQDNIKKEEAIRTDPGSKYQDGFPSQTNTPNFTGLFKYEIPLENDTVVYLYAPRRLPIGEKERLKRFIDLMLEEPLASVNNKTNNQQNVESTTTNEEG